MEGETNQETLSSVKHGRSKLIAQLYDLCYYLNFCVDHISHPRHSAMLGWSRHQRGGERKHLEWSCPVELVFRRFFPSSCFYFQHLSLILTLWNCGTHLQEFFPLHLLILDVENSSILYRWPCPLVRLSFTSFPPEFTFYSFFLKIGNVQTQTSHRIFSTSHKTKDATVL